MNRLVLVGNGFDLAHGLESSYEHFILWLMNDSIAKVYKDYKNVETDFFTVEPIRPLNNETFVPLQSVNHFYSDDTILRSKKISFLRSNEDSHTNPNRLKHHNLIFCVTSHLFSQLLHSKNWTDIEKEYFNILVKISNDNSGTSEKSLKELNKDFYKLKLKLAEYLVIAENNIDSPENNSLNDIVGLIDSNEFYKNYSKSILNFLQIKGGDGNPQNVIYINFNYTSILEEVLKKYGTRNLTKAKKAISIHGNIKSPESIIFGYGDESNNHFRSLEELDIEAYLVNFKSNYYPSNSEYWLLEGLLDWADFEVVVIGHSLGLSDRILFETIFEHEKCKLIHLAHTGGDSHFRRRIALSRHFKDKKKLRSKLVPESNILKYDRSPNK